MGNLRQRYPEQVDAEIKRNPIVLKTIPDNIQNSESKNLQTKSIKTARQLHEYIFNEKEFWTTELVANNAMVSNYPSLLDQALSSFNTLLDGKDSGMANQLTAILNLLNSCQISSKTKLAKTFEKHKGSSAHFFHGFKDAITGSRSNLQGYPDWHIGVIIGYGYVGIIQDLYGMFEEEKEELASTAMTAKNDITELMAKAEDEYNAQDKKYKELAEQANSYIKKKEEIITELESSYKEKLAFEDPADDWEAFSKEYQKDGRKWLRFGIILSAVIVSVLSLLIIFLPGLYQATDGWFNMARDTALVTVLVGVAIYALRIIFRLSISSFHLSRDARERYRLTKFYHAMKEAQLIKEEERTLVIQALFSRSETGLLKDSTPEMPTPVGDMAKKINPKG